MKISATTDTKLKKLQEELTDLALKLANLAKIELDFSVDSVKELEKILSQVHLDYKKHEKYKGKNGIALESAAYIVTVIEKNLIKGKWTRDSEEFGSDTFPYELKEGNVIFPYAWCLKRISDGPPENIWTKFQTLVLDKV